MCSVCCSVLQCVAVCCSVSQCAAVRGVGRAIDMRCSVLKCVAVCCSVLQMWCIVVHCTAVCFSVWRRSSCVCDTDQQKWNYRIRCLTPTSKKTYIQDWAGFSGQFGWFYSCYSLSVCSDEWFVFTTIVSGKVGSMTRYSIHSTCKGILATHCNTMQYTEHPATHGTVLSTKARKRNNFQNSGVAHNQFGPPKFFSKTFKFSLIFYSTLQISRGIFEKEKKGSSPSEKNNSTNWYVSEPKKISTKHSTNWYVSGVKILQVGMFWAILSPFNLQRNYCTRCNILWHIATHCNALHGA